MTYPFSPYVIVLLICAALSAALAWYVWHRRTSPGAIYFILLMVCAAEWSLTGFLEMALTDLQAKVISTQLSYLSVVFVGPLWLLFTLDYGRHQKWITRNTIALLCIIPVLTLAFVLTNTWHGLVWPEITLLSDAPGSTPIYQHGAVYWVHAGYSYALLLLGYGIMAVTAVRSAGRERLVTIALLAGVAVIWAGSMPYAITGTPIVGADLTPVAMTATGFVLTWLIFRKRLFDIVPVARETLIYSMSDGVIVISGEGLVAEMNPAARRLTGTPDRDIGKPAEEVLKSWPDLRRCCRGGAGDTRSEILLDGPAGPRWLDIRTSPLPAGDEGGSGSLVVMRDITEQKRSHEALRAEMLERKRAEEQIRVSLREKEVLLKEVHHRVKNNLQIISSLLSLQSGNAGEESTDALRESQNRIKTMALIHEKLYSSPDLSHIDFGEYAASLTAYLAQYYAASPGIAITIDIEDISLGIDQAIPSGLIINELISNSLKYAFKDGSRGTIYIGMTRDGNTYTLRVSDDGAGLPRGLDFRNPASLGLQLVNTLVDQLEGTIELDNTAGATYEIRFGGS
ncbi:sensor histidine kinase [Methanocella sp. MCL-LM]|uniref:sensor histidine kinase n=1 Tax=Methanocella sp. MCL-LM TaxID=3412035 RepID=UPI003C791CF1